MFKITTGLKTDRSFHHKKMIIESHFINYIIDTRTFMEHHVALLKKLFQPLINSREAVWASG